MVAALKHESSTDTDLLQRLEAKHAAVLEALLHYRAKCTPQEREKTAVETQARSSSSQKSTRFSNIDEVREHLEANLGREWCSSRNFDMTPPTTGAARHRREK